MKFKGVSKLLKDVKGLRIIVSLLQSPYKKLSNVGLASKNPQNAIESIDSRMAGNENLTPELKAKVKSEVTALLADRQVAVSLKEEESIKKIDRKIESIKDALKKNYDAELEISISKGVQKPIIKGREETIPQGLDKPRKNVWKLVNDFYKTVSELMPDLERYLRQCIDTKARYAVYEPDKAKTDKSIKWDVFRARGAELPKLRPPRWTTNYIDGKMSQATIPPNSRC